jgi:putative ABC transport system ATP-binding protein
MSQNYVTFTDVVREYHSGQVTVRAADGICFGLDKGKFSIIVGPSGAGKTTVLNILGGMDRATSGDVTVDGRDISRLSKRDICTYRRNDIGFV